jgi:hypothetical protein
LALREIFKFSASPAVDGYRRGVKGCHPGRKGVKGAGEWFVATFRFTPKTGVKAKKPPTVRSCLKLPAMKQPSQNLN